jgi:hypothetical protein
VVFDEHGQRPAFQTCVMDGKQRLEIHERVDLDPNP